MMIRRWVTLTCSFIITLFLIVGCNKVDPAIEEATEKINAIGTVTIDSGEAITAAEQAINKLSEEQLDQLENIRLVKEARESFDSLVEDEAKKAVQNIADYLNMLLDGDIPGAKKKLDEIEALFPSLPDEVKDYMIKNDSDNKNISGFFTSEGIEKQKEQIKSLCYPGTDLVIAEIPLDDLNSAAPVNNGYGFTAYNYYLSDPLLSEFYFCEYLKVLQKYYSMDLANVISEAEKEMVMHSYGYGSKPEAFDYIFTNNNKKIEIIGYTDKSAVFQIRIYD